MQAILAGNHQTVVETVSKNVGQEIAERYMDPEVDFALDRQIYRSIRAASRERTERHLKASPPTATATVTQAKEDEAQNLYSILLKMGNPNPISNGNGLATRTKERSPEIPFEQFRYSPKLTNYTGEPAKTPQEIKAIQELQSCVATNIRNLGSKALNTAEIAKQCKRLMVAYNIGQRLFAKYVMNQSQGSLSELLSKPRHWAKLTDKGREAFRRIYGWLSDDKAIDLLVSLSPRRVFPSEQKVEHPTPESMWESNSNKLPQEDPDEARRRIGAVSAREDQYRLAGTSQAANSGTTQRNSRWRHDDIPKEKIMSIFQTELAKLREQESNLERAIASRTFGTGHVRRMDDLNSPYHEMSHSERMASINQAHQVREAEEDEREEETAREVMSARMKQPLAPINQEEFEMFGHIDTEDVVRQIKEFLSMNSISQRQFGEHVLGLSQGSVSDLLARPKQWNQLTQKGREPFIRMKLFMQDIAAAGEKAKREKRIEERTQKADSPKGDLPKFSAIITTTPLANSSDVIVKEEVIDDDYPDESPSSQPDVIPEPDTALLVRKVKDRLHLHGISQRLFGEHVLGISAGGCSELFLRPRAWNTLNARGKEPYEKIITWLQDKDAIPKLLAKERAEAGLPSEIVNENGKRRLSDPPYDPPPRKVQRTVITDQQKEALRFVFQHEHHPSQKTVELLSMKLNLNIRTVNNWFHNHRTRQKASLKEGKVYSPAIGSRPKSTNWQEDLADMLENLTQSCYDDPLPTMVSLPNLFSSSSDDSKEDKEEKEKPSQLDKAVERIRLLAAAKCT